MNQETGRLLPQGASRRFRLSVGGFGRDHHVPQEIRRERPEGALAHRKREDIGAPRYPSIPPVELGYSPVVHQHEPALHPANPHASEGGLPDLF